MIVDVDGLTIVWKTASEDFKAKPKLNDEDGVVTIQDVREGIGLLVWEMLQKVLWLLHDVEKTYPDAGVEFWSG